jgi:GH24 family phage-related lysozyme (muramidase)
MKTETLHPVTDYIQEVINIIKREESFKPLPYFDTAEHPRATIGYGFNIEVPDYLLLVLRQMGINKNKGTLVLKQFAVDL